MTTLTGKLYISGPYDYVMVDKITAGFEKLLGQQVEFVVKQDKQLIGGFRAMIDGRLYDASIATKIDHMLRHLKDES